MSDDIDLVLIAKPSWLGKINKKEITEDELKAARTEIESDSALSKNGWTPEKLATYFKERKEAQSNTVLYRRPVKPKRANGWHNPHRWRR